MSLDRADVVIDGMTTVGENGPKNGTGKSRIVDRDGTFWAKRASVNIWIGSEGLWIEDCIERGSAMNRSISKILVAATFVAAFSVQGGAVVRTKAIVVEFPSDLPELAQGRGEAMYLHRTNGAQAILYIEQEQGRKLAFLDVTDPASIKAVGQVSIDAPSAYDFVQDLGDSAVLIRYRDHSGFAVISLKNYKQPMLKNEPEYLHPASVQPDGSSGILLVSANRASTPAREPEYEVLSISNPSSPAPLATISGVIQRLDRPSTGTVFLLNDQGLTVVRRLGAEQEHKIENWQKEHPG
ncbi:MAG: hypothetical protein JWO71_4747 [Candidatus Acidoferrum typicum]|nr:hypothetical protein [Candidatus Acidoferrum typicum]